MKATKDTSLTSPSTWDEATKVLAGINAITFLCGIIVLAVSGHSLSLMTARDGVSPEAYRQGLGYGLLVTLMSVVGYFGVVKQRYGMQMGHLFVLCIVTVLQLIVGGIMRTGTDDETAVEFKGQPAFGLLLCLIGVIEGIGFVAACFHLYGNPNFSFTKAVRAKYSASIAAGVTNMPKLEYCSIVVFLTALACLFSTIGASGRALTLCYTASGCTYYRWQSFAEYQSNSGFRYLYQGVGSGAATACVILAVFAGLTALCCNVAAVWGRYKVIKCHSIAFLCCSAGTVLDFLGVALFITSYSTSTGSDQLGYGVYLAFLAGLLFIPAAVFSNMKAAEKASEDAESEMGAVKSQSDAVSVKTTSIHLAVPKSGLQV